MMELAFIVGDIITKGILCPLTKFDITLDQIEGLRPTGLQRVRKSNVPLSTFSKF